MKNKKQIQKTLLRTKIKRLMITGGLAVLVAAPLLLGNGAMHKVNAAQGDVQINETNFPDAEFRRYISDKIDLNKDGVLSKAEIKKVKKIKLGWSDSKNNSQPYDCKDMTGIGVFTELTDLDFNRIGKVSILDLYKNKKLKTLDCSNIGLKKLNISSNKQLEYVDCSNNKLNNLNLNYNSRLVNLNCGWNKISKLNVTQNKELKTLACNSNKLIKLNISHNSKLTELSCGNNRLEELNVSNNPDLYLFWCDSNKLTKLDISRNRKLTYFYCQDNKITDLDVTKNSKLITLGCYGNKLTKLDLSNNLQLVELYCSSNKLTKLDVSHNSALWEVECSDNKLKKLDLSACNRLHYVICNTLSNIIVPDNVSDSDIECDSKQKLSIKRKTKTDKKDNWYVAGSGAPTAVYHITGTKKGNKTATLTQWLVGHSTFIDDEFAGIANEYTKDISFGNETYKVTEIGANVFRKVNFKNIKYDKKLNAIVVNYDVVIGNYVKKIGSNAFAYSYGMKSLTLGKSVEEIGANAFANSKDLKVLKIKSTKLTFKNLDKKAFAGITAKTTIKVPKSKLSTYKKLFRKCGLSKNVKIKAI